MLNWTTSFLGTIHVCFSLRLRTIPFAVHIPRWDEMSLLCWICASMTWLCGVGGATVLVALGCLYLFGLYCVFPRMTIGSLRKWFWLGRWCFRVAVLVIDLFFAAQMLTYLAQPVGNCEPFNEAILFDAWMPFNFNPPLPPYVNFREYLERIRALGLSNLKIESST